MSIFKKWFQVLEFKLKKVIMNVIYFYLYVKLNKIWHIINCKELFYIQFYPWNKLILSHNTTDRISKNIIIARISLNF